MDCYDCKLYFVNQFTRYCKKDKEKRMLINPYGHPDWCPGGEKCDTEDCLEQLTP